jgi:phosphoglucosamine mutase
MKLSGKKASELKKVMNVYPQVMVNIEATPEMKAKLNDIEVKSYIDIETARLDGDGRILVRPSGTEPLIRIMIEGREQEKINALVLECAETLKNLLN